MTGVQTCALPILLLLYVLLSFSVLLNAFFDSLFSAISCSSFKSLLLFDSFTILGCFSSILSFASGFSLLFGSSMCCSVSLSCFTSSGFSSSLGLSSWFDFVTSIWLSSVIFSVSTCSSLKGSSFLFWISSSVLLSSFVIFFYKIYYY